MEKRHTIAITVEDQPGVLTRIAGLFSRRSFNIDTITVGKSEREGISKMIISVIGDDHDLEQIEKQINKLIDTIKVSEMPEKSAFIAELCMIKVAVSDKKIKDDIFSYASVYNAKIVGMTNKTMTMYIVGEPENIESYIRLMSQFGIKEISRTGITAISKDW
ncbi:MAG: acetolactate synthase small subunit [Candidatus Micrarchaeota archaeon]